MSIFLVVAIIMAVLKIAGLIAISWWWVAFAWPGLPLLIATLLFAIAGAIFGAAARR